MLLTPARRRGREILDDPSIDPALSERSLHDVALANRFFGGRRAILREVRALLDASARLAKRLLSLGELHGQRTANSVTLRISQEDLAAFLGVSRQAVNQQLQAWKSRGWVDLGRGVVIVRDEDAIRNAAQ